MNTVDGYFSSKTEDDIRYRISKRIATSSDSEWLLKLLDITRAELNLVRADNAILRSSQYSNLPQSPPYGWPTIWCSSTTPQT